MQVGGGPTVAEVYEQPIFNIKDLPGITDPLGFFDPIGFTEGASEGKVRFYREVELKHCRVGMLAALGFLVGEQFHPLFDVDTPSYLAFQQTPLQTFWPAVVALIAVAEIYSVRLTARPWPSARPWPTALPQGYMHGVYLPRPASRVHACTKPRSCTPGGDRVHQTVTRL